MLHELIEEVRVGNYALSDLLEVRVVGQGSKRVCYFSLLSNIFVNRLIRNIWALLLCSSTRLENFKGKVGVTPCSSECSCAILSFQACDSHKFSNLALVNLKLPLDLSLLNHWLNFWQGYRQLLDYFGSFFISFLLRLRLITL